MRELKFRIWHKHAKHFCGNLKKYLLNIHTGELEVANYSDLYEEWYYSDHMENDYVIQQYTGMKDKNGREIYEGDIISGVCLNDGPQICVVGFDTFGIFYTKIKFYPCEEWDNVAMLAQEHNEIVGNIFENSELLK